VVELVGALVVALVVVEVLEEAKVEGLEVV
jgi:hypothetical protein